MRIRIFDRTGRYAYKDLKWHHEYLRPVSTDGRRHHPLKALTVSARAHAPEDTEGSFRISARTGKVTDCGYDQIVCLYTEVPADYDFSFRARVTAETYLPAANPTFQEAFGLFLRDTMEKDGETGYPYSNMAAVGGYYGTYNVFGRTGITADSIEDVRNFFLYGRERHPEAYRIGPESPRTFTLSIERRGAAILADMTDEEGRHLLYEDTGDRERTPGKGDFQNWEGRALIAMPETAFSQRDTKKNYIGFLAAAGSSLLVDKDSVELCLLRRRPDRDRKEDLIVSPSGDCTGDGSEEAPLDLRTAAAVSTDGQRIRCLPGVYVLDSDLVLGGTGVPGQPRTLCCDKGAAVLDFGGRQAGLRLCGDHWIVEGLAVIRGLGIRIEGSHNVVRRCVSHHNLETGILIRHPDMAAPREAWPCDNRIEDCDAFCNMDPSEHNADGFACKVAAGEGNAFIRCRSWLNSDDGFDLFAKNRRTGAVKLTDCVSCLNGYVLTEDGTIRETAGNGNGFKLGGSGLAVDHEAENCTAMGNKLFGFTSNSNPRMCLRRCTAGANKENYSYYYTGSASAARRTLEDCAEQETSVFDPGYWTGLARKIGKND